MLLRRGWGRRRNLVQPTLVTSLSLISIMKYRSVQLGTADYSNKAIRHKFLVKHIRSRKSRTNALWTFRVKGANVTVLCAGWCRSQKCWSVRFAFYPACHGGVIRMWEQLLTERAGSQNPREHRWSLKECRRWWGHLLGGLLARCRRIGWRWTGPCCWSRWRCPGSRGRSLWCLDKIQGNG